MKVVIGDTDSAVADILPVAVYPDWKEQCQHRPIEAKRNCLPKLESLPKSSRASAWKIIEHLAAVLPDRHGQVHSLRRERHVPTFHSRR